MLQRFKNISPASFFIMASLLFELLLNIVTPPLQANDEFNHFYRAYQISEGGFLPTKYDKRLGGEIPAGITDFTDQYKQFVYLLNLKYTITYSAIYNSCKIGAERQTRSFQDFPNTAYYSPVSYAPQAFILFILRQLGASPAVLYYGGRLFMFLLWLLCMYNIIKMLPAFKWLFTTLLLLPMNPFIVNSFSADTVTNILSFFFIAIILRHIFITRQITARHIFILGLLLVLLALAKIVYAGLGILLLAIPAQKFKNPYYRLGALFSLFMLSALAALSWSAVVMKFYTPFRDYNPRYGISATISSCADYYAQKNYLLQNPFHFFKVIGHTLTDHPFNYLSGYIGVLGNLEVSLPFYAYLLSYILLLVIAISEQNTFFLNVKQKLLMLFTVFFVFVLLLASQYLTWDCVGAQAVDLVQGRYLTPFFLLVFFSLSHPAIKPRFNVAQLIIPFILVLNACIYYVVYWRFFVGPPCQKTEIYCNAEEDNGYGFFKTSENNVALPEAAYRASSQHHSGKYSALLPPDGFCFTYKFKDLRQGDLIEAEAWEKCGKADIVFSGKGCGDFYFAGNLKSGINARGWKVIRNIYSVKKDCDSLEVGAYLWNAGKVAVYVDDLKFTIKRFRDAAQK